MIVKDIALFFRDGLISSTAKMIRLQIPEKMKEYIEQKHLYHITPNEEIANMIVKSEYLKPATGIGKTINSYGTSVACMFAGTPDVGNFMKNVTNTYLDKNPFLNPTMIVPAIEIDVGKEDLKKYKLRGFADNVVICEGYCVLPHNKIRKVQLVPDLIRNENGTPKIHKESGKYEGIEFRKRTKKEIELSPNKYIAKEDYLNYIKEKSIEYGYKENKNVFFNMSNLYNTLKHEGQYEGDITRNLIKENFLDTIKNMFKKSTQVKLDENVDKKIQRLMQEFSFDRKNPYRDKKFGITVAEFQKQGLTQLKLKDELEDLTTSPIGRYLNEKKSNNIDKDMTRKREISGINHNNRVAILTMLIAKNEGILENDQDNRIKDILISAAYYHDMGIIHSKRNVKKLNKLDLKHLNGKSYNREDMDLLKLCVEGQARQDENFDKLSQKYNIPESKRELAKKMLYVVKDADALDRVRLDSNLGVIFKTNLNPRYLRTDTSKRLINISYELEKLGKKVSFNNLFKYKSKNQIDEEKSKIQIRKDDFINNIKVDLSKLPDKTKKINKKLSLSKEKMKYVGSNIKNTVKHQNTSDIEVEK